MRELKYRKFLFPLALLLSGCGQPPAPQVPPVALDCPDPAQRLRLAPGSTYRDLARARAEAISGWRQCSDALAATNDLRTQR